MPNIDIYELTLSRLVNNLIERNKIESEIATDLMCFAPANENRVLYEIQTEGYNYLIVALEGTYSADLQRTIELYEKATFDELQLNYLRVQDIKPIPLEEIKGMKITNEGISASAHSVLFTSPIDKVVSREV